MSDNNKEKKVTSTQAKSKIFERTCSKCGSIITSKILKQCPICDTVLEELAIKIPEKKEGEESFLVFTGKKLELTNKYTIKKDQWTFKEATSVFFNSLVLYIFIELIIVGLFYMTLIDPTQSVQLPLNIEVITISQIPGAFLIIYPIVYIFLKKHKLTKIGLNRVKKNLIIAIVIGIAGGFLTFLASFLAAQLNNLLVSGGLEIFGPPSYLNEEYQIIRESLFIYKLLIPILLVLDTIGKEITFRGVFHKGLGEKFRSQIIDRVYIILIVSTVNSGLFLFLTFNLGFVIESFLVNIVLGIIYESTNRNLYSTLIASSFYTIISFIWILTIF